MNERRQQLRSWPGGIGSVIAGIVAVSLFVMMLVTVVDVLGRYFLGRPLPAAYEITELLMAVCIFSAMPLATAERLHVSISLFDRFFGGVRAHVRSLFVSLFCGLVVLGLAQQIFLRAERLREYGDHTLFLKAPLAPFAYFAFASAVVVGICFLALAAGALIAIIRGKPDGRTPADRTGRGAGPA